MSGAFSRLKAEAKELRAKSEYKVKYKALLENPLPLIKFETANSKSLHVSGHRPIEKLSTGVLGIPDDLMEHCMCDTAFLELESMFLRSLYTKNPDAILTYTSEADIQSGIKSLLDDIVALGAWNKLVAVHKETFVPHAKYLGKGKGSKSDFWMIATHHDHRPVLIVEVKSPHVPVQGGPDDDDDEETKQEYDQGDPPKCILDNPRVSGQIVDYMLDMASFHGQRNVYGVTTSGEYFKFHWLPHSDDDAASTEGMNDRSDIILPDPQPVLKRELICTETMHHTDPRVVPYLLTVLAKSLCSPLYTVPLISDSRVYIRLLEKSWEWSGLDRKVSEMAHLSLNFDHNLNQTSQFTVLRAFCRNVDQVVWLAFAGGTPRIVVLKQFPLERARDAQRELRIWQLVHEQKWARVLTVRGLPTLMMPLVLTVKESAEGVPQLDGDLFNYLYSLPPKANDESIPGHLRVLRQAILDSIIQEGFDQLDTLVRAAVSDLARYKVVHSDLTWRHFGVMPMIEKGHFQKVKAVLIDFSDVKENFDGDAASVMLAYIQDHLKRV